MELSGWLLLVCSWSVICGLAGYCMWRVLTDTERGGDADRGPDRP